MSNAIFPTFPGLAWSVFKTPEWSTNVQQSVSGKEVRMANRSRPVWRFSLSYEILRGASAYSEYQTLLAFYNARQGSFDSFLFNDTSDNTVTAQAIGSGDGVTKSFKLTHTIKGWTEPVGFAPSPGVYVNGVLAVPAKSTNLLTYSQQFDNAAWSQSGVTLTAGATAPDSTSTAYLMKESAANALHELDAPSVSLTAGTTYTLSVYAKAGARSVVNLGFPSVFGAAVSANFNLNNGTVGLTTGSPDATSITPVPGVPGWYRCAITWTPTASASGSTSIGIKSGSAVGTYLGDGASGAYVWGAQLEAGPTASPYIATTSSLTASGDYTCADGVNVVFNTAPANGAVIAWSGSFYYRVRFANDTMEFEQFMKDFWLLKKCDFRGVI